MRWFLTITFLLFSSLCLSPVQAQEARWIPVQDESRLLSEEQVARLQTIAKELYAETGIALEVRTVTYDPEKLVAVWGQENIDLTKVLLVGERSDPKQVIYKPAMGAFSRLDYGMHSSKMEEWGRYMFDRELSQVDRLMGMAEKLKTSLPSTMIQPPPAQRGGGKWLLGSLVLGALPLLGLVLLQGRENRPAPRAETARGEGIASQTVLGRGAQLFPKVVSTPPRFGGKFCGGGGAERSIF